MRKCEPVSGYKTPCVHWKLCKKNGGGIQVMNPINPTAGGKRNRGGTENLSINAASEAMQFQTFSIQRIPFRETGPLFFPLHVMSPKKNLIT